MAAHAASPPSDHEAAAALRRSLVPAALPRIPAAELAARYVPGQGKIGGDWYDVFTLPTGEHCAVIGDVAGSGLQAAVIMGRMRSTLRSYALETSDPADILGRLDRKMQYFEPGAARSRDRRLPPPIQIGGPLPRPKSRLTSVRFSHQGRFGHSGPDGHGQAGTRA
jgi:hypothetical protein